MRIVNNRFEIVGEVEKILNLETYKIKDLDDNNKMKRLTFYNEDKDEETIKYLLESLFEMSQVDHKLLLKSESFHIAETIDYKKADGRLYFLIHELKDGELIGKNKEKLDIKDKFYIILELMNFIDFLHFYGYTYKYLSPDNIFMNSNKEIKVRDLGFVSEDNVGISYQKVTEHFMSPELHKDVENVGYSSDYFSLGVMMKYLFLKDYRKLSIGKEDILETSNFNDDEKEKLLDIISKLTEENPSNRELNLRNYIDTIIKVFDIDYVYNLKSERNKINQQVNLAGRDLDIKRVIENDDLLYRGNIVYDVIFIMGQKGLGKSKMIRDLDFRLRMKGRQIINFKIDSHTNEQNKDIKNLLIHSIPLASKRMIKKYNLEFDGLLSSETNNKNDNIYFTDFKTKYRYFNRITNYFVELSKQEIVYIMIDDIQDADDNFISLLKHLITNLQSKRIIFIISCLELSSNAESLLEVELLEHRDKSLLLKINLKELEEKDFKKIIESKFGFAKEHEKLATFLYGVTEGNLLKIDSVINDLYNKNDIFMTDEGYWDITKKDYDDVFVHLDVHDILEEQLGRLSQKSYTFIKLASIFDKYIVENSIVEIMNIDSYEKDEIIKELLNFKIINKSSYFEKNEYRFYNRELKKMLYHKIDKEQKKILHKKAGDIILTHIEAGEKYILEEMAFQLRKSNRIDVALDVILKKAISEKTEFNNSSLYLWDLAYRLMKNNPSYKKENNTLYIVSKLIEIYFLKGENIDLYSYIKELNSLAKVQNNYYYLIKSKYYKSEYLMLKNRLKDIKNIIEEIFEIADINDIYQGVIMGRYLQSKIAFHEDNKEDLLKYSKDLINISGKYGYERCLGNTYNLLGVYNNHMGNTLEAIENFEESMKYFDKTEDLGGIIKPINNIASIYSEYYHNEDKALKYYEKGYEIAEKYDLLAGIAIFSLNIGGLHLERLDLDQALYYTKKSNDIYDIREDFRGIILSKINLTRINLYKDDLKKTFDSFLAVDNLYKNNITIDKEVNIAYNDLLAKIYGYFGNLDDALKHTILTKNAFKKFNKKEYHKSSLMEVYYNYSIDNSIDEKQKNIIFSILNTYTKKKMNNELLIVILRIAQLSITNGEVDLVKDMLAIYNKFKSSNEFKEMKIVRKSIENNLNFNLNDLKQLEEIDLNEFSTSTRFPVHFNLATSLIENKEYKKAIYHLLKCIENVFKVLEYIKQEDIKMNFIKFKKTDLVKTYIENAIKLEYNKNLECLKLEDIGPDEIYRYFNFDRIIEILDPKEVDSIFHIYSQEKEIADIEELLSLMGNNYKLNIDKILKYISYKTLAEKGFVILYDNNVNEYRVLSSINKEDVEEFDLNKVIYLDREKEGIFLNKNSSKVDEKDVIEILSKDNIAVLGVPIDSNTEDGYTDEERRNIDNEKYKGYIYLETKNYINKFNIDSFNNLKSISRLIYLNIDNYMLRNISSTDKLTNAMTRKHFDTSLERYISDNLNKKLQFTLLMLDLDDFKSINDTYGHLKGDDVLQSVGKKLADSIRITDLLGRYGGDEFTIALLDTSLEEGIKIAEKIREAVEKNKLPGIERSMTVTIGVAHYPTHGKYKKELISRGDDALYFAKEELGKNEVAAWNDSLLEKKDSDIRENAISQNRILDEKMIFTITQVTNLISQKIDIKEKAKLFLNILIENLKSEVAHLVFVRGAQITSSIVKMRESKDSTKTSRYKLNIIYKALSSKRAEYYIDWENYDQINPLTGAPDWNSIIYVPLIKKGNVVAIVYLSVPIREKEFNRNDFYLIKLLSDIFSANF